MKKELKFGFDIGETSLGWSVLDSQTNEIVALGVRAWDKSEDRKGRGLNEIRTEKSNVRKTLRRRKHRKDRVKNLLVKENIITKEELIYIENNPGVNIFELRYKAINENISNTEIARLCIYFSGHRGFKSSDSKGNSDSGVIKAALNENKKLMQENNYKTFGEMLYIDEKFKHRKRNSNGDYIVSVDRELINEEIDFILSKQNVNIEFIRKYKDILNSQRSFASGDDILNRVGYCTFEKDKKRCAKATLSFQKFKVMQDLTKVKLVDDKLDIRYLTKEEKNILFQEIFNNKKDKSLTYKDARKLLNIDKNILFANIENANKKETSEISNISDYITLKKIFKKLSYNINDLSDEIIDNIATILTLYKEDEIIINKLNDLNLDNELIEELKELNFTKFGHLSLEAIRKINIGLYEGMNYNEACEYVGYNFKNENLKENKTELLPGFDKNKIINKSVYKTCVEFRKVLNALIKKYGSPARIHLESTRELGKSDEQKHKIKLKNDSNNKLNKIIVEELKELRGCDSEPSSKMLLKYKLYKEQNAICMYSGKPIDLINMLYDENYAQVDHILPKSRSFDNTYDNKVLVLTKENQDKRNMTPYEYMKENDIVWHQFEQRVLYSNLSKRKKQNLLDKTFSEKEKGFLDRNLHYTSWAIREISNHLKQNLLFDGNYKKNVYEINGSITSQVRGLLGIYKDRDKDDLHHAVDAVIVALCDDKMVKAYSNYWLSREKRLKNKFEKPYDNFEYILEDKLKDVIVSRPEVKKNNGKMFEDTLYGYGGRTENGEEIITYKTNVKDIKFNKDGDFNMFNKESNLDTYNKIKNNYLQNKNTEPVIGDNGIEIKKITQYECVKGGNIRIIKNKNGGYSARTGGEIKRVDIYSKDGKYYCVPVYFCDKGTPKQYIEQGKPKHMWNSVNNTYKFEFSLYKGSIIKMESKKDADVFYYRSIDSSTGIATCHMLNSKEVKIRKGIKTLKSIKKLKIDVLGNIID